MSKLTVFGVKAIKVQIDLLILHLVSMSTDTHINNKSQQDLHAICELDL